MKERYRIELTPAQRRLTVQAMIEFRNDVLARGIDTVDIDRIILKLQGKHHWWQR